MPSHKERNARVLKIVACCLGVVFGTVGDAQPASLAESSPPISDREAGTHAAARSQASSPDEVSATPQPMGTVFDEILIGAPMTPIVGPEHEIGHREITEIPYGDAAEVLRRVSGVAVGRMGGHGLEPRLRGMAETNINVLLDGAYVHNACPNRMDPPSSFGAVESFDRVVVLKGVQTVRYGGGGSAGTILYQRRTPRFAAGERWRLNLGTAASSHAEQPDLTLDAAAGTQRFYLRTIGESRDVGNYDDGGGAEVRSAFKKRDASVEFGWTPDAATAISFGYENNRTEDALFPGSGMDAPFDENSLFRLKLRRLRRGERISAIESEVYWGEIDHVMDNYSLRPLAAPMFAKAETGSDTFGGRFSVDSRAGDEMRFTLGVDFQRNTRRAIRFVGPNAQSVSREQSILWPDAEITDAGVFFEGVWDLAAGRRLLFGTRLDRFEALAGEAARQPFGPNLSPATLYELYYGSAVAEWRHDDVTALLRLEQDLTSSVTLFTGLSRSVRAADATERFLASNGSSPAARWVGNPGLDASRHHQLDLGASLRRTALQVTGVVFFDRADGYIVRDLARGQGGILQRDGASIYRNVDAELLGLELDAWQRLGARFSLSANAGWVRADNSTDERPIAQIPPLQGRVRIDFEEAEWTSSATLRYALRQTRVDADPAVGSGLDAGETPGSVVFDLVASRGLIEGLELQVGVENAFDRLYADHLNRSNLFDLEQVRVNEPGRTFWLRLRLRTSGEG